MQLTTTSQNILAALGYTLADFAKHLRQAKQLASSYDLASRLGYAENAEREVVRHQKMIDRLGYDPLSLSCYE